VPLVPYVRRPAGEQPLQVDLPPLRVLHELRGLLLSGGMKKYAASILHTQ
jgi:hypothetical protein